jgi:hypothetical protein
MKGTQQYLFDSGQMRQSQESIVGMSGSKTADSGRTVC